MKFTLCCVFAIAISVEAGQNLKFKDSKMPIRHVITSYGQGDHERIDFLEAIIFPSHINNKDRINFPSSGHLNEYFKKAKAAGDERGHLVASQFSGPAEWYNLSPQNARVNRNAGYQSITTDWYNSECEVRKFLDKKGNRFVRWRVTMTYTGKSNRPHEYRLQVTFYKDKKQVGGGIDTKIRNPLLKEDSTFWICRACHSNKYVKDPLGRHQLNKGSCQRAPKRKG